MAQKSSLKLTFNDLSVSQKQEFMNIEEQMIINNVEVNEHNLCWEAIEQEGRKFDHKMYNSI